MIETIRQAAKTLTFKAGESIFVEGNLGGEMFGVLEGTVQIQFRGRPLEDIEPGGIFGEMSLIDESPRSANAVALTDCKVAAMNDTEFLRLVGRKPSFALGVMGVMARRLRRETEIDR